MSEAAKIPFASYVAQEGVNNSALKWFRKSPAHYKAYRAGLLEEEPTLPQRLGTAAHALLLELEEQFVVFPETYPAAKGINKPWNRNANYCKAWEKEQNQPAIYLEQANKIRAARKAVESNKYVASLLHGGVAEAVITARCPKSGLLLKARADYLKPRALIDLKTAADASTGGFTRAAAKYRYAHQLALYRYIAILNGYDIVDCILVALELDPIPMPNAVLLSEKDIEIATQDLHRTLAELAECESEDHWPGYCDTQAHKITLPTWAHMDGDEEALDLNA